MPKKGYKQTIEHIKKLSKVKKGKMPKNLGVSFTHKGIKHSKETKRKISDAHKGMKKPWNKKPLTEDHRNKISKALKGNKNTLGYKHTEESKRKMSESLKGRIVWNKNKRGIYSEESKKKMSEAHINNPNRKFKETGIELKVEAELIKRNINYQKQVPLCKIAIVDFYLPKYRIVIQCDGDYWHNREGSKERDDEQDKVLIFNGFNVYRFWEHEINKSAKKCIDKLF